MSTLEVCYPAAFTSLDAIVIELVHQYSRLCQFHQVKCFGEVQGDALCPSSFLAITAETSLMKSGSSVSPAGPVCLKAMLLWGQDAILLKVMHNGSHDNVL